MYVQKVYRKKRSLPESDSSLVSGSHGFERRESAPCIYKQLCSTLTNFYYHPPPSASGETRGGMEKRPVRRPLGNDANAAAFHPNGNGENTARRYTSRTTTTTTTTLPTSSFSQHSQCISVMTLSQGFPSPTLLSPAFFIVKTCCASPLVVLRLLNLSSMKYAWKIDKGYKGKTSPFSNYSSYRSI